MLDEEGLDVVEEYDDVVVVGAVEVVVVVVVVVSGGALLKLTRAAKPRAMSLMSTILILGRELE